MPNRSLPERLFLSVIDLLSDKKIEVPNYTTFADEITLQYQKFEDNLVERLAQHISSDDKQALDKLINKSPVHYQRPLLVCLKNINQSINPGKIKQSVHGFLIIKKLKQELAKLIKELNISSEAIRYYAQWVVKAKLTQLTDITDENKRYLYLLAFVTHQFKVWQDTLMDVILKSIQHYRNKAEFMVNALYSENITEKNKLTTSVLQAYNEHHVSVKAVRSILYNQGYSDAQKVSSLYKIVSKGESSLEVQAEEAATSLFDKIQDEQDNQNFYIILEKLSRKLQNRVADCIKHLGFVAHHTLSPLNEALQHYQSSMQLNRNST